MPFLLPHTQQHKNPRIQDCERLLVQERWEDIHSKECGWGEQSPIAWIQLDGHSVVTTLHDFLRHM